MTSIMSHNASRSQQKPLRQDNMLVKHGKLMEKDGHGTSSCEVLWHREPFKVMQSICRAEARPHAVLPNTRQQQQMLLCNFTGDQSSVRQYWHVLSPAWQAFYDASHCRASQLEPCLSLHAAVTITGVKWRSGDFSRSALVFDLRSSWWKILDRNMLIRNVPKYWIKTCAGCVNQQIPS